MTAIRGCRSGKGAALCLLGLATALAWAGPVQACDSFVEELSVVGNGAVIGQLQATTADCRAEVTFAVSDNGRGAKLAEQLEYDDRALPRSYRISGASEFGGPVDERYEQKDGQVSWSSQADSGEIHDPQGRLYLANDASPYSLAVYARALLAAPGARLHTAPDGELRIAKVAEQALEADGQSVRVSFYRIDGRDVAPDYVVLDERQRMFASGSGEPFVIRKGWEGKAAPIQEEIERLEQQRARNLQAQLAHRIDTSLSITNVRIFDAATGTLGPLVDVVVEGDRISAISPAASASASSLQGQATLEGAGGVLIPGLHDMHAHLRPQDGLPYLAAGVTTVRDMGNNNEKLREIVRQIEAGTIAGPAVVANGFIEGKSAYSANQGFVVDNLAAALEAVEWYGARGYWQIKLYNSFDPAWVKPVAERAHALGMGLTGHIPAFTTPDAMIDAGYDEIAHVNQLMLGWLLKPGEDSRTTLRLTGMQRAADLDLASPAVQATLDHMVRKRIALDTTVVILEQLMMSRSGATPPTFAPVIEHLPIAYRRDVRRTYMTLSSEEEDARYRQAFQKVLDLVRLLHERHVRLLPGTDYREGFAMHRELELYAMAGIAPAEVLSNATLGMARYLGQDRDSGSIEVGKKADMVLLRSDPTRDISAVRSASAVFKGGRVYFPDEIYRALNIVPFGKAPETHLVRDHRASQ